MGATIRRSFVFAAKGRRDISTRLAECVINQERIGSPRTVRNGDEETRAHLFPRRGAHSSHPDPDFGKRSFWLCTNVSRFVSEPVTTPATYRNQTGRRANKFHYSPKCRIWRIARSPRNPIEVDYAPFVFISSTVYLFKITV